MIKKNDQLRTLRRQTGFTQKQLADMVGYTRQYYAQIESGKRKMPDGLYEVAVSKMYQRSIELTVLLYNHAKNCDVKPDL